MLGTSLSTSRNDAARHDGRCKVWRLCTRLMSGFCQVQWRVYITCHPQCHILSQIPVRLAMSAVPVRVRE